MLLLPVALFVAVIVYYMNLMEMEGAEESLRNTATATVAALDRQISSEIAVLEALATHPDLDHGNIPGFLERAGRIVPTRKGWDSIAVTEQETSLGNTRTGAAGPPRPLTDPEGVGEVYRSGHPYVSGIFPPNDRVPEPFYTVRVPVIRDGAVRYTLSAAVRAWSLHGVLEQLPVPGGGRIGFLDHTGRIIARSSSVDLRDPLIGQLPSQSVLDGARRDTKGLFEATPIDGPPVYMVAKRHEASGWTALISAPIAVLDAPRKRMLALAGGGAFAALLLTTGVGTAMARSTTRRIEAERRVAALEAEAGKRQAESLLAKVMDALPVGVFILDEHGLVVGTNPEGHRIWGGAPAVSQDGYAQYKGWHRATGRRIQGHEWAAARALKTGETTRDEAVDIEGFDGQRRTITNVAIPLTDERGRIVGAVTVNDDITERDRMQEELRLSNERMRLVLNANVIGIVTSREDGSLLDTNDYYLDLIGFSRAEFDAGLVNWRDLTPPEYLPLDEQAITQVQTHGLSVPYEKEQVRRDGTRIWIHLVVAKLAGTDNIVAFVQNYSHRRRIEEQKALALRQAEDAQREAERANRSKSGFLAAASHDLRQPVQSLFFLLAALEGRVAPSAEKTLSHATEAVSALKALLDSLLDISRLDAGAIEPDIAEFPMSTLLDQIDAEYRPIATAKGLDWHVLAGTAMVRSDPALLGRVLRNLCQNAIRYTDAGSVLVRCRTVADRLMVEVEDTGIGIPVDQQGAIFEEFQQLDNAHRDRAQGFGLGLAIVRRLADLLMLRVEVRSTPGEGSIFTVAVPLAEAPAARHPEARHPEAGVIPIAQGVGRFVVLIEDEDLIRLGTTSLLRSWGYDVLEAGSGPQALAALQGRPRVPDLILSDYRLPEEQNGIGVIRGIRALFGATIRAILLTGETSRDCLIEAAAEDITVLHKPISTHQLRTALSVETAATRRAEG